MYGLHDGVEIGKRFDLIRIIGCGAPGHGDEIVFRWKDSAPEKPAARVIVVPDPFQQKQVGLVLVLYRGKEQAVLQVQASAVETGVAHLSHVGAFEIRLPELLDRFGKMRLKIFQFELVVVKKVVDNFFVAVIRVNMFYAPGLLFLILETGWRGLNTEHRRTHQSMRA